MGIGYDSDDSDAGETSSNLASREWNRYQEHGKLRHLEQAIWYGRDALSIQRRSGQPNPLTMLNLGVSLFDLFNHTRNLKALDESVRLLEHALILMSAGESNLSSRTSPQPDVEINDAEHANFPRGKINLGNAYRARAEMLGDAADYDRAVELHESVLFQTSATHAVWDLETRQNCLARSLMARGSKRDVERAMDLLSFRRSFRDENTDKGVKMTEETPRDRENTIEVRFRSRHLGVFDADIGIPVPDLTDHILKVSEHPSGCGGYADIFMGEWTHSTLKQKVAIKVLRHHSLGDSSNSPSQIKDRIQKMIKAEVRIWHKLEHPNVVRLLGTSRGFGPFPAMICSWYANGNLSNFLRKHKSLLYSDRLRLVREAASGLYFLHSNAIIHGDLTGANILIDEKHTACIADFGLSVLARDFDLPGMSSFSSGTGGSIRWTAPELYKYGNAQSESKAPSVTTYSDVYSFGCVALEIFSGQMPYYYAQHDMDVLLNYITKGIHPERPRDVHVVEDRHWAILEQCWSSETQARPKSNTLCDLFDDTST